jgi:hypothetical protein
VGAKRPPAPLQLGKATAKLVEGGAVDAVKLSWRMQKGSSRPDDVWVRWSNDGGETWRALTVGQTGSGTEIALDQLPAGQVRFQILAHDGFSTASSTTEAIELPAKAPAVTILYPTTDDVVYAERHLHLWGAATSFSGAQIPDESFTWLIDGHEVGHGRDLWVESPEPGSHEVRLAVSDEAGSRSATSNPHLRPAPTSGTESPGDAD